MQDFFGSVDVEMHVVGGEILLRNRTDLPDHPGTLIQILKSWAARKPDAVFLGERVADQWRLRTFGQLWARTAELGRRLLAAGCSAERPVMILAPNSIAHAEVALAAMRVGVPACPVSMAYATSSGDFERLRHVASLATPALLVRLAGNAAASAARAIADMVGSSITFEELDRLPLCELVEIAAAEAAVGPDTVAKLLFTSGSTAKPKGVPNTHRMLCSNQAALACIWPGLARSHQTLVDWLPWNHTFGGNFTFNLALYQGGTFLIDAGKPLPVLIGQTVQNLREHSPTVYFNVPAGYEALLPHLESDQALRRSFFARLEFLFTAAAALPQSTADRLQRLAWAETGREVPLLAGWGSTETAPCATATYFRNCASANIGVPLPGTEVRMVADRDKLELRVKGPNVMPGYWRDAHASSRAFDERGFYRMGDAGRLADANQLERGIIFDGRTSENFKLLSGTWVQVGALRLAVIDALRPFVQDVVIAGHDRREIGVLLFPNLQGVRTILPSETLEDAMFAHPVLIERFTRELSHLNESSGGISTRIARYIVLKVPPQADAYEITDKGYLNQLAVLTNRAALVEGLFGAQGYVVP